MRDLEWLQETFTALDRVFWHDALTEKGVKVCWSRFRPVKCWFRYGAYNPATKVIEINPVLQHDWVPDEVVCLTLHHEMVHAIQGPKTKSHESMYDHDRAFWAAELRYPYAETAYRWCEENINRLIEARPPRLTKKRPAGTV